MAELTPDRIRAAVLILRQRTASATPPPWMVTTKSGRYGGIVGPVRDYPDDVDGYGGELVAESVRPHNGQFFGVMGPPTANAVAELLCLHASHLQYAPPRQSKPFRDAVLALVEAIEAGANDSPTAQALGVTE